MLADVSLDVELVIVMVLLLFAATAVIKFIIASRGCTCDESFAQMVW